jgi:hypothetical protein
MSESPRPSVRITARNSAYEMRPFCSRSKAEKATELPELARARVNARGGSSGAADLCSGSSSDVAMADASSVASTAFVPTLPSLSSSSTSKLLLKRGGASSPRPKTCRSLAITCRIITSSHATSKGSSMR